MHRRTVKSFGSTAPAAGWITVSSTSAEDGAESTGDSAIIEQILILNDMKAGTRNNFKARISAAGGSGSRVLTAVSAIVFEGEKLRFSSIPADAKHDDRHEWVVVDLKAGKEVAREPADERALAAMLEHTFGPVPRHLLAMLEGKFYYVDLVQKTSRVVSAPDTLREAYPVIKRAVAIP